MSMSQGTADNCTFILIIWWRTKIQQNQGCRKNSRNVGMTGILKNCRTLIITLTLET